MSGYYKAGLAGERLKRCYELAPPRVRQYLQAEIDYARSVIQPTDTILELGCGYGRILASLSSACELAVGIDTSEVSLQFGCAEYGPDRPFELVCMDAGRLAFRPNSFDRLFCLQNGISAFKIEPLTMLNECLRVVTPDGAVYFSTYSPAFWNDRLAWFEAQSAAGLVGPIDYQKTGNGIIACTDGFTARTATGEEFQRLAQQAGVQCRLSEVDQSSLVAEFRPTPTGD